MGALFVMVCNAMYWAVQADRFKMSDETLRGLDAFAHASQVKP